MDIVRAPKRRTRRNVLVGVGVTVAVLVTVLLARLDPAMPVVPRAGILIDSVRRGDVVREVRGPGTLVPEHIRWITAQASARVDRKYQESGASVVAGALILEMSNPDLQIQTLQAEQQVRQAEIDLLNLRTTLRTQVLTQEGVVAGMRTSYVAASQEAAVADSLWRQQLISDFERRNRQAQAEEFTVRLRIERERLALMTQAIDSQIAVQASQVRQLRAIAGNQQARLHALQVRAPEQGVLQELTLQLGQWVPEGTTLAKVVQPGRLKAVLRIPESQARDVILGQRAAVDTRNGIVQGTVARKDPSAAGGTITVDIALEGALPAGAVPDLGIDGTIEIEKMSGVLHTGRPAMTSGAGMTGLFRLEPSGDVAVRVPVELGRSSVNTIEILRGLGVGDRVILSDMTSYGNVERVRIK